MLLRHYVSPKGVPLALGLFAVSSSLIYYSAELKQYSSDVLMTLILYNFVSCIQRKDYDPKFIKSLGLLGAFVIWVSYPCIIVFAGMGIALFAVICMKKHWEKLPAFVYAFLSCSVSFVLLYTLRLGKTANNKFLLEYWDGSFFPYPLFSFQSLIWFKTKFLLFFHNPMGISIPVLGLALFILGCFSMFKRKKEQFFFLLLPLILTILAAAMRKYPLGARLLLFWIPMTLIFITEGVSFFLSKMRRGSIAIGIVVAGLLLFSPIKTSAYHLRNDRCVSESRDVMQYFEENLEPGDSLLLNELAKTPYWYYRNNLEFKGRPTVISSEDWGGPVYEPARIGVFFDKLGMESLRPYAIFELQLHKYNSDGFYRGEVRLPESLAMLRKVYKNNSLSFLNNSRVWVFFSHTKPEVKELILNVMDNGGREIKSFEKKDASIYLYEINKEEVE